MVATFSCTPFLLLGPSSKRQRQAYTLWDAIEEAGLVQKAIQNGESDLSRLDSKERVSVLGFLGSPVDKANKYDSVSTTAVALRKSSFQEVEVLSTPPGSGTLFPVVDT